MPPWPKRVPLIVPPGEDELKRMIQATFDVGNFVAFAYSTVDTRRGLDFTGHRIVLNPGPFDGRSDESTLTVMAHELMHIATRDAAGPFVPIFVDEGFADYAGSDADPGALAFFNSEVAAGLFAGELPGDHEFTIGDSTDIYRSYQASQSAVRYFIERYGLERFVRFYRKLGRRRIVVGTARHHLDKVLRDVVGTGYGAFERAWADSISSP